MFHGNSNILLSGYHPCIASGRKNFHIMKGLRNIYVPKCWGNNFNDSGHYSWEQRISFEGGQPQKFKYMIFLPWIIWNRKIFLYDFKYFEIYREDNSLY